MTDLAHAIQTLPLADTHEHLEREEVYLANPPDILQELFWGMCSMTWARRGPRNRIWKA